MVKPRGGLTNEDNTFSIKNRPNENVTVGPSESMSKSKKNIIDPAKMIEAYGADAVRFLYYQTAHQKKMFSGLTRVWPHHINIFKNCGH